jgi:hypothetical protein
MLMRVFFLQNKIKTMITQKCLLVFFCLLFGWNSFAQKNSNIHEVGLTFNSNLDFGLIYKTGTEKSVFRLQGLFLNGSHQSAPNGNNTNLNNNSYGFGISLGSEFRQNIAKNLFLIYGFGAGAQYVGQDVINNGIVEQYHHIFSPKINLVVGFSYVLKEHWIFSIEALPYIQYDAITQSSGNSLGVVSSRITYGMNMASVRLVIAHRFGKKESE